MEEIVTHKISQASVSRGKADGIFEICDPNFGNLWSNIPVNDILKNGFQYGDVLTVTICHAGEVVYQNKLPFAKSFGYVKQGEAVVYTNELMKIGVATSMGNFRETYHVDFGYDWTVRLVK